MGQSLSVLPAVETVAVVINAVSGIEMLTSKMLEWTGNRKQCRMIIINKIDVADVDLLTLVENIKEHFGNECLPLNLPADNGTKIVDCFFNPSGDSDLGSVADAHTEIIDQVVEVDEKLMEIYLEQGDELSPQQLHEPFEKALREGHLIPICFVSAQTGAGIPELLEIITRLMPSPLEGNSPEFLQSETPINTTPNPDKDVIAHVFKVIADPFVGKLAMFRIHQGTVTKNSQLYIGDARKPFKNSHLLKIQGEQHNEIDRGIPGDICAVAKVEEMHFDAVLHGLH
ncbi:MAG: hypothetical protein KAG43_04990 [Candidatus Marithrix sp.]|nr:hypothetical protein [Candidatus Marithrix sp.]